MRFIKALILLLLAALFLAVPAAAQKKTVILTKQVWPYPNAAVDLDFVNGRYYGSGFIPDINKYITTVRTQTGSISSSNLFPTSPSGFAYTTYPVNTIRIIPGVGIINELVRTNILLNSAAPATQTTPSMAIGTWFLWVNGSGSATMSAGTGTDCGTGVATNGNPVTITITIAGTCTVTVAGSLNAFQLETVTAAAQGPSSFITTAGANAFRNFDSYEFLVGSPVQIISASGTGTILCEITRPHLAIATNCFAATTNANNFITTGVSGGSFISRSSGNTILTALDGGPSVSTIDKIAVAWDGSGRCIVWNAGTPVCDANTFNPTTTVFAYSQNGATNPMIPGRRLSFWSVKLPTATLQALTK